MKKSFFFFTMLNLHAIDATTPARWRGGAGSSPLDRASTAASWPRNDVVKSYRLHPTHWLISTQATDLRTGAINDLVVLKASWATEAVAAQRSV